VAAWPLPQTPSVDLPPPQGSNSTLGLTCASPAGSRGRWGVVSAKAVLSHFSAAVLFGLLDYRRLRRAVRRAESLRLVRLPQLVEAVRRLTARRGVRTLTRVLAMGPAPTRSELEDADRRTPRRSRLPMA
jgi:hypothetical protein